MSQPSQNLRRSGCLSTVRNRWTVDHDDRKTKRAGGGDFGISPGAACVFGHDDVDGMGPHQGFVIGLRERTARYENLRSRQGRSGLWRVHQTQKVEVLRVGGELRKVHPPHSQHDALGRPVQRGDGACDVWHMGPSVTGPRLPRRAGQGDQRNTGLRASGNGVSAHLRGEGMRGVNHVRDFMGAKIFSKPVRTAKTTDPLGQGLARRPINSARERHNACDPGIGQRLRQRRRLSGAAKDQEVRCHG